MNAEDFISFFRNGERSFKDFKQGVEWELFLVDKETFMPIQYYGKSGIERILYDLSNELSYSQVFEEGNLVGLRGQKSYVTLEGGGQIEFSSTPYNSIIDLKNELENYLSSLKRVTASHNISIMAVPYHPIASVSTVTEIPKRRYSCILDYFKCYGEELSRNMVKLTSSIHTTIDYSSEKDFVKKLRVASLLIPIFSAIYGNSPISSGHLSDFISYRGNVWQHTEKVRSGLIKNMFEKDFGYLSYIKYILELPLIKGFGNEFGISGISLEEYAKNREFGISEEEWAEFLSYSYTEVRAKKFIEIRCFDNQCSLAMILSIPALLKGIFYTSSNILDEVENLLFNCLGISFYSSFKNSVNLKGLGSKWNDLSVLSLAQEIYKISKNAMNEFYSSETEFLLPLEKYLFELKSSPGEVIVKNIREKQLTVSETIKGYLL